MPISFLRGPVLGLLCLFHLSIFGQNPTFQKAIGGLNSSEIGFSVTELPDGYLIAGATNKGNFNGAFDALLIRTDLDGSIIWQKTYGEFAGDDEFRVAKIANDGGFIVFGTTENYGPGNVNAWLLKIDDDGNVIWHKTLGEQDPKTYGSEHLIVLPDGYLLSCRRNETLASSSRTVVVRVNNNGDVVWSKVPFSDRANYMGFQFVKDGLAYGCGTGSVNFNENQGIWAALDVETGEVQQAFSYHSQEREDLYSIRPTADGNLIMAGSSSPPASGIPAIQAWVQKVQPDGTVIWSKRYEFPQRLQQLPQLELDNDGGFVLNMHLNYILTDNDPQLDEKPALMKIDAQGNVLWNRQYSTTESGFLNSFGPGSSGGWIGVGSTYSQASVTGDVLLIKTDPEGRLESCCTRQQDVAVSDFPNSFVFFPFVPANYAEFQVQNFVSSDEELFDLTEVCLDSQVVLLDTLRFCPGEGVTIGGTLYDQPGVVVETLPASGNGCDTLVKHVLELLPQPALNDTLRFCPGESVTIGGTSYNQPGIIEITLPASNGCDTLATYVLELLPQPALNDTLRFCSGESVTIGGASYNQPGIIEITLPASGGCDTLATYVLEWLNAHQPNTLSITCPPNVTVTAAAGATSANVVYNAPATESECPCPGLSAILLSGASSGSAFPLGLSTVCYRADDACGHSASCCFTVKVENSENPCDVKTAGCISFELLDIKRDAALNWAYRIRVTNNCAAELSYLYIGVPAGITAYSPANNGLYAAPSGRVYLTRNPNYSPMYSVRFKPQDAGISAGQSDIFRYVLPQQADVDYINAGVRLASGAYMESYLNTFNCPVGTEGGNPRPAEERATTENWRVFPNPVSGHNHLNVTGPGTEKPWLELRDLTGRLVFSGQVLEQGLALEAIPVGMYVYRIFDPTSLVGSGKLVVVH